MIRIRAIAGYLLAAWLALGVGGACAQAAVFSWSLDPFWTSAWVKYHFPLDHRQHRPRGQLCDCRHHSLQGVRGARIPNSYV